MYPVLFSLGPFTLYSFGLLAFFAFLFGSFVFWKRGRESNLAEEDLFDGIILVTVCGLLAARFTYILLHFQRFGFSLLHWLSFVNIPGFTFYGGLVGGGIALWLTGRHKRWSFFSVSDIVVTSLSLVQAIGWLGALFSGFGYGRETTRLGIVFPGSTSPRFPIQILWMLGFVLLFIFLWKVEQRYRTFDWYRGKKAGTQTGFLTFTYLIALGLFQMLIAQLNEARVYWFGAVPEIWIGWLLLVTGIIGLYWRSGREVSDDWSQLKARFKFGRAEGGRIGKLFERLRTGTMKKKDHHEN